MSDRTAADEARELVAELASQGDLDPLLNEGPRLLQSLVDENDALRRELSDKDPHRVCRGNFFSLSAENDALRAALDEAARDRVAGISEVERLSSLCSAAGIDGLEQQLAVMQAENNALSAEVVAAKKQAAEYATMRCPGSVGADAGCPAVLWWKRKHAGERSELEREIWIFRGKADALRARVAELDKQLCDSHIRHYQDQDEASAINAALQKECDSLRNQASALKTEMYSRGKRIDQLESELAATKCVVERRQTGTVIESDYITPDGERVVADPWTRIAELEQALEEILSINDSDNCRWAARAALRKGEP